MTGHNVFVAATALALKALAAGAVIAVTGRAFVHGDTITWVFLIGAAWAWKAGAWLDGDE